jgi:hypothetical protein
MPGSRVEQNRNIKSMDFKKLITNLIADPTKA